jgi:predicted transposase YbfD/YdcC
VADFFGEYSPNQGKRREGCAYKKTVHKGHGRIETREYAICDDVAWLLKNCPNWSSIRSIG